MKCIPSEPENKTKERNSVKIKKRPERQVREGEGVEGPSPALGVRKALRGSWRRYCVGTG